MDKIKFSHRYAKLGFTSEKAINSGYYPLNFTTGILLWFTQKSNRPTEAVLVTIKFIDDISILPSDFKTHDSMYFIYREDNIPGLSLPLFFSTLRRWTREKEEYYRSMIGKAFEVVITEE